MSKSSCTWAEIYTPTLVDSIKSSGPRRVVIDHGGTAITYKKALNKNIIPTLIFIRDDLWTLGAPDKLIEVARELWHDYWVAVLDIASGKAIDYQTWLTHYRQTN